MAVLKLSQIAVAGGAPAATDQIVGVTTGTTDNLFSLTQINTSVLNTIGMAVGSAKITGGTNARILFDNAGVLGEYTAASANSFLGTATGTGANTDVAFWTGTSTLSGDAGFTYGGQGTNPMATLATGTITTNVKALNITGTFNNAATTFDAPLFMNITNTASHSGSLIADFQVASATVLALNVNGTLYVGQSSNINAPSAPTIVFGNPGSIGSQIAGDANQNLVFWCGSNFLYLDGQHSRSTVLNNQPLAFNSSANPSVAPDIFVYRDAVAAVLALSDSTTASGFRVYNTTDQVGTGTAPTNFERFTHDWTTSANVATLGTQNGGTGSARAMNIITGGTNAITISTAQAVAFPGVGTTASAANAFLDNAASNNLLRSTSSLRYKKAVTRVPSERVQALMALQPIEFQSRASADNPDTRFVGYAAEEVARIDPALVSLDKDGQPDGVMYDRVLLLKIAALEQLVKELQG